MSGSTFCWLSATCHLGFVISSQNMLEGKLQRLQCRITALCAKATTGMIVFRNAHLDMLLVTTIQYSLPPIHPCCKYWPRLAGAPIPRSENDVFSLPD
ncbi:hypothetical protein PAXRUDRAFT_707580 [Paxillus rubicundulus Ve08.2h10]|uniref:Unplaced genomic scaffold scaffold_782, whole genome shotgun sequence n=1 Tax=Paxillus rubicundulus Ve08.2h10 TaxID=930991 RepID=A0A0D0DEL1_9AGAM|nr:hypothetical protein PAXRUDRAFT_707580 [Paxillus rubicundulus Ve08.2h10]